MCAHSTLAQLFLISSLQEAMRLSKAGLQLCSSELELATYIKRGFDKMFHPTWHCVVGRSFGTSPALPGEPSTDCPFLRLRHRQRRGQLFILLFRAWQKGAAHAQPAPTGRWRCLKLRLAVSCKVGRFAWASGAAVQDCWFEVLEAARTIPVLLLIPLPLALLPSPC